MARRTDNFTMHDFYCIKCGNKGLSLPRRRTKEKYHRKKLFCFICKEEINHVEIKSWEEKEEFLSEYREGKYKNEVAKEESFFTGGNTREWKVNFC